MINKINRIKHLVILLNDYRDEYYNNHNSRISDFEYDQLFDELCALEQETGFVMKNSPTQTVGYKVKSELNKVKHNHPMLSLDKTKDIEEIKRFVENKNWIAMLKMDGLTCSLLYERGKLIRAETRGDGEIGEDITHNAMVISSIPKKIPYMDRLIVDGEIICKLDDFKEFEGEYKNARNFASGSIRLLDSNECSKRKLTFVAWDIIGECGKECGTLNEKLGKLIDLDFEIVPFTIIGTIDESIEWLKNHTNNYPIDGLVFKINKCSEYEAMGKTEHHFRGGLAYKFYDELYETKLIDIEWTMGKTNILTPTAIFKTVNIDGTDISKASLHNISIIKKLGLTNNCTIQVYKANQIIPQVDSCKQDGDSVVEIPEYCPICNGKTKVVKENESEVLVCTNPTCSGQLLGKLKFFASKPAMNIDGLSGATLNFLINKGWIKTFKDIYYLEKYQIEWQKCDGFGKKSVEKILDAIEKSRNVKLENFITALSVPNIGLSAAKTIAEFCNGDIHGWFNAFFNNFDWTKLDDFGKIMAKSVDEYLYWHIADVEALADEMNFIVEEKSTDTSLNGLKFCITGSFSQSRDVLKQKLEAKGAKFVSSVSKNLNVLFAGDKAGSKLTKAQNLGVKVVYEEELMKMLEE